MTPDWAYKAADEVLGRWGEIQRLGDETFLAAPDPAIRRDVVRDALARVIAAEFFRRDRPAAARDT